MESISDAIAKVAGIDAAIENALKNEVATAVRDAIVASALKNVYAAYSPSFMSRRDGAGGILDPNSVRIVVEGTELTARDEATWQQLWGGEVPKKRLADAIATGDTRFHMQRAGPRPFHQKAKERIIADGTAAEALRRGLARQGYDASDIALEFI